MSNTEWPIEKNQYLVFDALSLKQYIKDQLNKTGAFTDQNFEGSYISSINDIVAYTFNTLMYYLNRTSTESMFSDSQLYENMNRIVKILNYNPVGKQTSTLSFQASALDGLAPGLYTIPRYSYVNVNGIPFSFNEDVVIRKTVATDQVEELDSLSEQKLLYQGKFQEYPVITATGEDNEIVFLLPGDAVKIDHFNIQVYIKSDGVWSQWEETPSLYLENATAEKFEVRLNENKHYEIKFGNDINGKKLTAGDTIAIYYLESDGENGQITAGSINGKPLVTYLSTQFSEIYEDVTNPDISTLTDATKIRFENSNTSTFSNDEETTDEIRQNAPGIFRSQYRLVTQADYENFVRTNFANLIHDVKAINNWSYLSEYLKYFYDLGLNDPNQASRPLYNQVMFGDACNFNNVYLFVVPKTVQSSNTPNNYLPPATKELILSSMLSEKTLTTEVIIMDPVYIAFSIGIPKTGITPTVDDIENTQLVIVKQPTSRRDDTAIMQDVEEIFTDYFDRSNVALGQEIDVNDLSRQILSVNGVQTFYTQRTDDTNITYEGLNLMSWSPTYSTEDVELIIKNVTLEFFKYPYLYDKANFANKLKVESATKIYETVEF